MQELEKILEEIRAIAIELKNEHWGDDERHLMGKGVEVMCVQAEQIIRKHMDNDGWIPVEERLPKKGGKDTWYLVQVIGGEKPYMILNYHTEYEVFGEIERDRFLGDHIRGTAYRWHPLP